jgi:hypothetical protein
MRANRFWLYLVAIFAAGIAIRLVPLAEYALVGDDLGRYIYVVDSLIETGGFTYTFPGWGSSEAEFVGFYGIFGIFASLFGIDSSRVLSIAPLFSLIAIAMIILLVLKVFRNEKIALIAGAFLAVSPLFALVSQRPVKAVLGFPLFALCLLMLYLSYRDRRSLPILYASTLALVLTHNFTTYFLIIAVLAMVFLRELGREQNDVGKLKIEVPFLAFLLVLSLSYVLILAPEFGKSLLSEIQSTIPLPIWALFLIGSTLQVLLPLIVHIKRRWTGLREFWARISREYVRRAKGFKMTAITFGVLSAIIVIFFFVPLPIGLEYSFSPFYLIWIIPTALSVSFAATGQFFCKGEEKIFIYLTVAPIVSLLFALVTQIDFLYPFRHGDYIAMPAFVLVGAALTGMKTKWKNLLKYGTLSLLIVCGLVAYPPSQARAYDEGFTDGELEAIYWIKDMRERGEITPAEVIAAGLGESALIFGITKHEGVTWSDAYWIFASEDFDDKCEGEVARLNISYVFVSAQMWRAGIFAKSGKSESGIGDFLLPSGKALLKFFLDPFELVYPEDMPGYGFDYYHELMWDDERGELDVMKLPKDAVWIFRVKGESFYPEP